MTTSLLLTQYDLIEIDSMSFFRIPILKKFCCLTIIIFLLICLSNNSLNQTRNRMKRSVQQSNVVQFPERTHYIHLKNLYEPYHLLLKPIFYRKRKPKVVATVLTTAERFRNRQVIRETWANPNNSRNIKNGKAKIYFLLSSPKNRKMLNDLKQEQHQYNDLIITNLTESYKNLYQKVYAAFLFVHTYYPEASFHMKIDDDVLLDIDRMFEFLDDNEKSRSSIRCKVWDKSIPKRNKQHKWYISKEQWSPYYYPRYCDGPVYIVGQIALKSLIHNAKSINFFPLEDVLFTGIIPESSHVERVLWSSHIYHYNTELWWKISECDKRKIPLLFAVHSLNSAKKMKFGYDVLRNLTCVTHSQILSKRSVFYSKKKPQNSSKIH